MDYLKPAVRNDGAYQNPVETEIGTLANLPRILMAGMREKTVRRPKRTPGPFVTEPHAFDQPPASGLRVTLLGHSSLLLEIDGTRLLVDPVYSRRASMVQWAGPERLFPPPLPIADLPPLDAVLLSHDHYDHLDSAAMEMLTERTPAFVCSLGVDTHLRRWGVPAAQIHPMNWMDRLSLPSGLEITALPARHFSGRGLKRNETLWSSFALRGASHSIYFGADSGPWPGFEQIGQRFGPFDLAMIEVGAWNALWGSIHLGPECASEAFQALNAKVMMPIHWGLFNLAFHDWWQPAERSMELAEQRGYPLFLPQPGQPTEFTGEALNSLWWRPFR